TTAFPSRPCNATPVRHAGRWRSRAGGIPTKTAAPAAASRVRQRSHATSERASEKNEARAPTQPSPNLNGLRHPGGARPRPRPPPPRRSRPPHRHGARRRRRASAPSLAPLRRRAPRRRRPHRRARPRPRTPPPLLSTQTSPTLTGDTPPGERWPDWG
uniref:Uncharacterized protein n=1 Tax=Aegilops tauschii subsp. strangulata TaxID=200361 RepID=A0A452YFX8_AEGTS